MGEGTFSSSLSCGRDGEADNAAARVSSEADAPRSEAVSEDEGEFRQAPYHTAQRAQEGNASPVHPTPANSSNNAESERVWNASVRAYIMQGTGMD